MRASDCRVSLLTWYGPLAPRCAETCSNMDDLLDDGAAPAEANMFESMETPAPAGDMFEAPAPEGNMFESMETPASEALPTFGSEPAPAPEMGMGGMGGMGAEMFNTDMGPLAQWRTEREEKLAAKAAEAEAALKSKIEEAQGQIATFYADLKEKSEKRAQTNLCAPALDLPCRPSPAPPPPPPPPPPPTQAQGLRGGQGWAAPSVPLTPRPSLSLSLLHSLPPAHLLARTAPPPSTAALR